MKIEYKRNRNTIIFYIQTHYLFASKQKATLQGQIDNTENEDLNM